MRSVSSRTLLSTRLSVVTPTGRKLFEVFRAPWGVSPEVPSRQPAAWRTPPPVYSR